MHDMTTVLLDKKWLLILHVSHLIPSEMHAITKSNMTYRHLVLEQQHRGDHRVLALLLQATSLHLTVNDASITS